MSFSTCPVSPRNSSYPLHIQLRQPRADKGTKQGIQRWPLDIDALLSTLTPRPANLFCCGSNKLHPSWQKRKLLRVCVRYFTSTNAWRDLLGNNNPSLKMSPVLICTHNLQTSKCLLSINIFIRSSILLPLVPHPGSKHSECQETPLTQSQQGMGFGKGHFQVPAGSQQLSLTAARDLAPSSRLLAWRLFP